MHQIIADNIPQAFEEALNKITVCGVHEESRNGLVLTFQDPVLMTIKYPTQRVITDPVRNANPFFHVMETVWMFAGRKDAKWISYFNSRMVAYADDGGLINGAYGHRWITHFGFDQISMCILRLQRDPTTRQAVIAMWDPVFDNRETNDRPCNTTIYFRVVDDALNMTVCNRSNDLIWGMLGANAVHLTYLHELVALSTGISIGKYQVFTNNLHMYTDLHNFDVLIKPRGLFDVYTQCEPQPLLQQGENWNMLQGDCKLICDGKSLYNFKTAWGGDVAYPMYLAYRKRAGEKKSGSEEVSKITAPDWNIACEYWLARHPIHAV